MGAVFEKIDIHLLPDPLWKTDQRDFRSCELTPIYIDRYDGVRTNTSLSGHDFWELTYVFKGRGMLKAEKDIPLTQYTACLIPPHMPHTELSKDKMDTLWVGLRGSKLDLLDDNQIYTVKSPELNSVFEKLWFKTERPYGAIGPELDGIVLTGFGLFIRLAMDAKRQNQDYIDVAVEYMKKNFSSPLSISAVAGKIGYSEGYFYRAFKKRTGQTPINFLTRLRMQHAHRMLQHTSLTVDKISKMAGYRDPLYFSKVFRKFTGKSPSQIRAF